MTKQNLNLQFTTFRFQDKVTTRRTRITLRFSRVFLKNRQPEKLHCNFSSKKLTQLFLLKGVKPYPEHK